MHSRKELPSWATMQMQNNSQRDSGTGVLMCCFSYLPKFSVSGLTRYIRFLSVCSGCNRSKLTCYHGEGEKKRYQLLVEACRRSWYLKSYLKDPYVHSPYLREAEVKDVSIQLLHCSREPVPAEILPTELTVEGPHTHIYTQQNTVAMHLLQTSAFSLLAFYQQTRLAQASVVSPGQVMWTTCKLKDPIQPNHFGSPFKSCLISCSRTFCPLKTEQSNSSIRKPAEMLHNHRVLTLAITASVGMVVMGWRLD